MFIVFPFQKTPEKIIKVSIIDSYVVIIISMHYTQDWKFVFVFVSSLGVVIVKSVYYQNFIPPFTRFVPRF
jgi:hypothetical protein